MTPDASTWRSSAQYDHLDELTASDLAWEWLRRNDDYDADFEASIADHGDPQPLTERIRQRWGLRFPRKTRSFCPTATGGVVAAERSRRPLSDSTAELSAVQLKQPRRQVRCGP